MSKINNAGMTVAQTLASDMASKLNMTVEQFTQAAKFVVGFSEIVTTPSEFVAPAAPSKPGRGPGRPKGSKNKKRGPGRPKAKRGPGRPKAKRGPGRPKKAGVAKRGPGRPKGSKNKTESVKRKTVKGGTGARRGRKPANGVSVREAVANILRNANGPIGIDAVVAQLNKQGFNSKSLKQQVSQELTRLFKAKSVTRPGRGEYVWSGAPGVVGAVTTPADSEQAA